MAALVAGGGVFAGIHYGGEVRAFIGEPRTRHVVELIPASEVRKAERATKPRRVSATGSRAQATERRESPADHGIHPARLAELRRPNGEIDRGPTTRRRVALTFDAGADPRPTAAILDALRGRGARCTFFLTGRWVRQYPSMARAIAAGGHELGNHTDTHRDLTSLSDDAIAAELQRAAAAIRTACGRGAAPFFRPPLGARDLRVTTVAEREGYETIYWTVDSLDSIRSDATAESIRARVLEQAEPGAIVLLHCGSQATAAALPSLLADLARAGYRVVTVGELLRG